MGRRKKVSTAQPIWLTIPDVAIQLQVCRATVYNWIYFHGLPSTKVGGARRICPHELREWVERNKKYGQLA